MPTGDLDTRFGLAGFAAAAAFARDGAWGNAVARAPGGALAVAGGAVAEAPNLALARFLGA